MLFPKRNGLKFCRTVSDASLSDTHAPFPGSQGEIVGTSRENTAAAFQSAIELGVDVIETDVHLTKDGRVLVWHDENLEKACGDERPISEMTARDVQALDAGALFSPDGGKTFPFRDKGIHPLLLEEALAEFPLIRFNIDLKDNNSALASAAAEIFQAAGAEDRICIGSFHNRVLKDFRRACPGCATSLSRRELLLLLFLRLIGLTLPLIKKKRVRILQMPESAGPIRLLTEGFIRWCKKRELVIQVWTINDPEDMDRLFQAGVDGIFSDDARKVIAAARRAAF